MAEQHDARRLEQVIRSGLASLVSDGPQPRSRFAAIDERVADHQRQFDLRRRVVTGTAAAAVTGVGLTWWSRRDDRPVDHAITTGTPAPSAPGSVSQWQPIAPAPLSARVAPSVVWAGDRLFVWGGVRDIENPSLAPPDGAVWHPSSARWTPVADAPSGAPPNGFAVWDGSELIVGPLEVDAYAPWNAGRPTPELRSGFAAYAPATDTWRHVAPVPALTPYAETGWQAAVVPGGKILVAPRSARPLSTDNVDDVALIDISNGQTTPIDPGPFAASPWPDNSARVALAAVGSTVVASPNWDLSVWILDPSDSTWRRHDGPTDEALERQLHLPNGTPAGDVIIYVRSDGFGRPWILDLADPSRPTWRPAQPRPELPALLRYDPVWSGRELFVAGAAYDPNTDQWRAIALPDDGQPERELQARWADGALVLFGGDPEPCPSGASCTAPRGSDALDGWTLDSP